MAVKLDNLDDIIKSMSKMETDVETMVIREARKNLRATVRKYQPIFKKITPVGTTGEMAKSTKIKSRSKRGVSSVQMVWMASYAGYVNFKKSNKKSPFFASDKFLAVKKQMDADGLEDVKDAFRKMFKANGIKVIE
jgi:HK97 gp10 family phage protein